MSTREKRAAERRRRKQINTIGLVVVGLLIIAGIVWMLAGKPATASTNVKVAQVGQAVGDFSLADINGNTVSLSDYAGQVVLINAWATWCPPCKAEMPDLNAYYQAHQDEGFVILAVNAGDPASAAAAFAEQKGLAFPVLLDPNTALLTGLGIQSYPTSILVGADGVVKIIHMGMFTAQSLEEEITPYLAK